VGIQQRISCGEFFSQATLEFGFLHHEKLPINLVEFFTKFGFTRQIFLNVPNIRFHGNPSCKGRTDIYFGHTNDHDKGNRYSS